MKKTELQKEGFGVKSDKNVYFWSNEEGKYVPFTNDLYEKIVAGNIKLWRFSQFMHVQHIYCNKIKTVNVKGEWHDVQGFDSHFSWSVSFCIFLHESLVTKVIPIMDQ